MSCNIKTCRVAGMLLVGVLAGCASMERTFRDWTDLDQGLADLDRNEDGVISRQEAEANQTLAGAFDRIDTNQDRNINPAELRAAYLRLAELDFDATDFNGDGVISQREADSVRPSLGETFDRVDADQDGNVSRAEYEAAHLNLLSSTEFASFDTDGDGIIDRDEAREQRALEEEFSSVDIDGDGMISEKEYKQAQSQ